MTPSAAAAAPNRWRATTPKAMPAIAPANSDGARTPPKPPIPMVRLAVNIFAAMRMSRTTGPHCQRWPGSSPGSRPRTSAAVPAAPGPAGRRRRLAVPTPACPSTRRRRCPRPCRGSRETPRRSARRPDRGPRHYDPVRCFGPGHAGVHQHGAPCISRVPRRLYRIDPPGLRTGPAAFASWCQQHQLRLPDRATMPPPVHRSRVLPVRRRRGIARPFTCSAGAAARLD